VIRLPSSAIRIEGSSAHVWIVDASAGRVFSRPVTLTGAPVPGSDVTVAEGIDPGDRVVVAGVHKLQEGQPIRLAREMTK